MQVILYLIKIHFIIIYFFIKLFTRQRKRVYLLSRQFDSPSINYQIIIDELKKKNIDYKVKCKKVETSINDSMRTQGHYSNTVGLIKRLFGKFKSSIPYYFSLLGQMVDIAKSKVIIVDGYNLPVSLLKHKKGTKVIQQWHALGAIKKFGYQSIGKVDGINPKVAKILKMHAGYDYVISGSEGMNKYFAEAFNVPEDKVLAIGTPSIDFLKKVDPKVTKNIYKKYPEMKNKINVLYSPTFRNEKNYNYQELIDNTDFNKVNLIITNHFKVEEKAEDQRIIAIDSKEFSTFDILKMVDYVITDYSALMIDAAVINKKILLYVYDFEQYDKNNGVNLDLLNEFSTITYKEADKLMNVINKDKYDKAAYKRFQELYTPHIDKTSTEATMDLIKRCLDE
ncbi:MAG: CDP-glycerol glycerophosphotransferase family protein [Bacilli bacterium]|nr:CDP-glycerol glycerophosphotransferase family protein [Bacilli bacterium]